MSKGRDRNAGGELSYQYAKDPFTLSNSDKVMQYFQNLRDEVHNLAIRTYRKKHSESFYKSRLDDIAGIGNQKSSFYLIIWLSSKYQRCKYRCVSKSSNSRKRSCKKCFSILKLIQYIFNFIYF